MNDPLLPEEPTVYGGQITIREESLPDGKKGYYQDGDIVLEKDQPLGGKVIILIHELFHACESVALHMGLIEKRLPEKFVTMAAGIIGRVLMESGLVEATLNLE